MDEKQVTLEDLDRTMGRLRMMLAHYRELCKRTGTPFPEPDEDEDEYDNPAN